MGHVVGVIFGARREDGAHAEVIGAVLLRLDSLLDRLGRDADDLGGAKRLAGLDAGHVGLADMDAISATLHGKFHVVIDDEGHTVLCAERLQCERFGQEFILRHGVSLFAHLDIGHAALKGRFRIFQKPFPQGVVRYRNTGLFEFLFHPPAVRDAVEGEVLFIFDVDHVTSPRTSRLRQAVPVSCC